LDLIAQQVAVEFLGGGGTEQARGESGDCIALAIGETCRIGRIEECLGAPLGVLLGWWAVIAQRVEGVGRRDPGEDVDEIGHLRAPAPRRRRSRVPEPLRWPAARSTAGRSRSSPAPSAPGS